MSRHKDLGGLLYLVPIKKKFLFKIFKFKIYVPKVERRGRAFLLEYTYKTTRKLASIQFHLYVSFPAVVNLKNISWLTWPERRIRDFAVQCVTGSRPAITTTFYFLPYGFTL